LTPFDDNGISVGIIIALNISVDSMVAAATVLVNDSKNILNQ
jgi:hypothetical protein